MEIMLWILGIIIFLISLALFIGLHEAGHALVAKIFKLDVPKFFIGFGPTLWSKKTKGGGTEYGVKAIPLGGFVMIEDPNQEEESYERMALAHVNPIKRILIFLAGPLVNIILGVLILMSVFLIYPYKYISTQVETTNTCVVAEKTNASCGAYKAGMKKGDTVTKIDNMKIKESEDFDKALKGKEVVTVEVLRKGETVVIENVNLKKDKLGINLATHERAATVAESWSGVTNIIAMNVQSVVRIYEKVPPLVEHVFGGGKKSAETPSSVIVVGKTYGDTAASPEISTPSKVQILLTYAGLFNLGIGFLNLLILLPLDGGRIFIAFMDIIKGFYAKIAKKKYNPVSSKTVTYMTIGMMGVLFSFFILVMISDVMGIAQGVV